MLTKTAAALPSPALLDYELPLLGRKGLDPLLHDLWNTGRPVVHDQKAEKKKGVEKRGWSIPRGITPSAVERLALQGRRVYRTEQKLTFNPTETVPDGELEKEAQWAFLAKLLGRAGGGLLRGGARLVSRGGAPRSGLALSRAAEGLTQAASKVTSPYSRWAAGRAAAREAVARGIAVPRGGLAAIPRAPGVEQLAKNPVMAVRPPSGRPLSGEIAAPLNGGPVPQPWSQPGQIARNLRARGALEPRPPAAASPNDPVARAQQALHPESGPMPAPTPGASAPSAAPPSPNTPTGPGAQGGGAVEDWGARQAQVATNAPPAAAITNVHGAGAPEGLAAARPGVMDIAKNYFKPETWSKAWEGQGTKLMTATAMGMGLMQGQSPIAAGIGALAPLPFYRAGFIPGMAASMVAGNVADRFFPGSAAAPPPAAPSPIPQAPMGFNGYPMM